MTVWNLSDLHLHVDGAAREFIAQGRLPAAIAIAQIGSAKTATEIWRGYRIAGEALPDHMLVVTDAQFELPDLLTLHGNIEGPR